MFGAKTPSLAFHRKRRIIAPHSHFDSKEGKAMTPSQSPIRFPAPRHTTAETNARKAEDFESMARLVEDLIPNFKKEEERQFYRKVVQSYRAASRDILRKA
jgi:hypothetical protein